MKLSDYLRQNQILITDECADPAAFYQVLTDFMAKNGHIRVGNHVKRLFLKRESIQSTGIGRGAATPHIYSQEFAGFRIFVVLVKAGIDFKAPDGGRVHLILPIVSDDREVGLHLKSLARIARLVLNTDVVEKARSATDSKELIQIIRDEENRLAAAVH